MEILISGLVTGSLYALLGVALVLIYRSSGILNFAQGDMATVSVFIAFALISFGVPWFFAALIVALISGLFGVGTYASLIRPVARRSPLIALVVTFGFGMILAGVVIYIWGPEPRAFPAAVDGPPLEIGPFTISTSGLLALVAAVVVMVTMYFVMQRTRAGVTLRATYQDPMAARLMGVRTFWVYASVWGISAVLGAISAMLIAPLVFLSPYLMNQLLLVAFTAIVLGGLSSPLGAVLGGLILGVIQSLISAYLTNDFQSTALFLVLLVILTIRPQGLFGKRTRVTDVQPQAESDEGRVGPIGKLIDQIPALRLSARSGRLFATGGGAVLLIALALVPLLFAPFIVASLTQIFSLVLLVASVTVLTGAAGQLSIGQAGLAAIGAYTTALLGNAINLPFPVLMLLSVLVAGAAGGLLGIPALRLSGPYLALVTLAFAWAVPEVLIGWSDLTGGYAGMFVPSPNFFGMELTGAREVYYLSLATVTVGLVLVAWTMRSRLGKRWRAIRDNENAAVAVGIAPTPYKLAAFAFSACVAGLGGSLSALQVGYVSPESFPVSLSIQVLLVAVIGGLTSWIGAVFGAAFLIILPLLLGAFPSVIAQVVFGVVLLVTVFLAPGGFVGVFRRGHRGSWTRSTAQPVGAASSGIPTEVPKR